jgi:photosystem II stability/assembly factor-like uncharacterized protein
MKNILLFLFLIAIGFSSMAQSGWETLTSNYLNSLNDVVVVNDSAAICVGGNITSGVVLGTANSGNSWLPSPFSFSSALNAAAFSTNGFWTVGDGGKIYYSVDGSAWILQSSGTTADLNDIQFPTANVAYIVGDSGVIRKDTTGFGTNWFNTVVAVKTKNIINAAFFTSATNGVIVGDSSMIGGFAARTTSSGGYFSVPYFAFNNINDVAFIDASNGLAVANSGNIYKTVNGGVSWTLSSSGVTVNLNAIHFSDANYGYIVGDGGTILKTTDGGATWIQQNSPTTNNLFGVYGLDSNLVYAVGASGTIIKTSTGGAYLTVNVDDDTVYCNGYANLIAQTAYTGDGSLTYSWASSPFLSNTTDSLTTAGPLTMTETFYVTVTDGNMTATDSATISVTALPPDSICIVTVDEDLGYNVVVFEKHVLGAIDHYNIYAESSVAGVYDSIGFIPADSAGVFVDTNSNPAVKAYSYKISTIDSCGNESDMSDFHKTMHLTINQGSGTTWNLIWNFYEGIPVQTYRIWRADTSLNWTKIDSVPGTNSSYTDQNPPAGGLFYQVEIISPYICQPYNYKANTNYNTSRSNTANNGLINAAITAVFTATPHTGSVPLDVQFTNSSVGGATDYIWYFGDGDTAMTANPMHTYTVEGVYTVKLVAYNATTADSIVEIDLIDAQPNGFNNINNKNAIRIFPNPMSNKESLTIQHQGVVVSDITVIDILGKRVDVELSKSNGQTQLNFKEISRGIYFISLYNVNGLIVQKKFIVK